MQVVFFSSVSGDEKLWISNESSNTFHKKHIKAYKVERTYVHFTFDITGNVEAKETSQQNQGGGDSKYSKEGSRLLDFITELKQFVTKISELVCKNWRLSWTDER